MPRLLIAELVVLAVSAYLYIATFSGTLLVAFWALAQMHFGKQPGLGYDPIGHKGANLVHTLLSAFRQASLAVFVVGFVGLCGELTRRTPEKTLTVALIAGAVTLVAAYWVPGVLAQLDNNARRIPASEGQLCIVTEPIPARGSGFGKVRIRDGGRSADYVAESVGTAFDEGTRVRIIHVGENGHVEVGSELF
jgi:hypothetical protein